MKKLLLTLSALAILGLPKLSAQLINPDFETWTTNLVATNAKDPNSGNGSNGWWDFNMFNFFVLGSSPITVLRDSVNPTAEHGKYCAKIISAGMTATSYTTLKSYGFPYPDTNGLILTGNIDVVGVNVTVKKGIPYTTRIKSFSFYYMYTPNGSDTCSCTVALYHHNSVTNTQELIGSGSWHNSSKVTSWTKDSVNITYDSATSKVDTIYIQFSASSLYRNPKSRDTLDIDNTAVTVPTGIDNIIAESDKVNVYPNPANNAINIAVSGHIQATRMEVYDITGKTLGSYTLRNNFLTINTQPYNNGLYFYKLFDNEGVQLNIGKFSIVR